ncbi:hypothetical protein D9M72_630350 [compost metagenome]
MISAIRKRGTVMPRKEMPDSRLSIQEYCRVAARMPKVMPMIDARMWQTSASARVRGSRSPTTSATGLL